MLAAYYCIVFSSQSQQILYITVYEVFCMSISPEYFQHLITVCDFRLQLLQLAAESLFGSTVYIQASFVWVQSVCQWTNSRLYIMLTLQITVWVQWLQAS